MTKILARGLLIMSIGGCWIPFSSARGESFELIVRQSLQMDRDSDLVYVAENHKPIQVKESSEGIFSRPVELVAHAGKQPDSCFVIKPRSLVYHEVVFDSNSGSLIANLVQDQFGLARVADQNYTLKAKVWVDRKLYKVVSFSVGCDFGETAKQNHEKNSIFYALKDFFEVKAIEQSQPQKNRKVAGKQQ